MMTGKPWYSNFAEPHSTPRSVTDEEVATLVSDPSKIAGKDYLVVDVRRTDFGTHMVRSAINIPAHSFYYTRHTLVEALGNVPLVIFYCSSSVGRGPRCAGWFQDTLNEAGKTGSEAVVLVGGIKKWADAHKDLTDSVLHFPDS